MSVQQIGNLNIEMQNVLPAQAVAPTEKLPEEMLPKEIPSDLPEDSAGQSRTVCTCVDTYA
jgi:hypothetical protein